MTNLPRYRAWFRLTIILTGWLLLIFAAVHLSPAKVDVHFMVLAAMIMAASQFAVRLPSIGGRITVADTLVFLALLLYGREAAVVLAALEGLSSSLRISKKPETILFNSAVMSASILMTAGALQLVCKYP